MIILVGSDLVTRRERREGVLSGAEEVEDCGGFLAAAAVEAVEDGCVDVWSPCPCLPNENVELIDAPMMNRLFDFSLNDVN